MFLIFTTQLYNVLCNYTAILFISCQEGSIATEIFPTPNTPLSSLPVGSKEPHALTEVAGPGAFRRLRQTSLAGVVRIPLLLRITDAINDTARVWLQNEKKHHLLNFNSTSGIDIHSFNSRLCRNPFQNNYKYVRWRCYAGLPWRRRKKGPLPRLAYDQRPYIIETMHSYTLPM